MKDLYENVPLMAILSLAVIVLLVAVLVSFVNQITKILKHTAYILDIGKGLAGGIRKDCEGIVGAVLALNTNLKGAAGGLQSVAAAANRAASGVKAAPPAPAPAPAPAAPAPAPSPEEAAAAQDARSAWMSTPRGRFAAPAPEPEAPAE